MGDQAFSVLCSETFKNHAKD